MKAFIFIILFLFTVLSLKAQLYFKPIINSSQEFIKKKYNNSENQMLADTIKYTKNFKLYVNASYKEYSADFINYTNSDKYSKESEISYFNYGYISFALELKNKKGNYHEMEVTPIIIKEYTVIDYITKLSDSLTQAISGMSIIDLERSTTYQFSYSFNKKENSKIEPYIGFASNLYSSMKIKSPVVPNTYRTKYSFFGIALSLIPGIKIKLTSKSSLDINIPFRFYEYNSGRTIISEPFSSDQTRLSRDIYGKFFPKKYYLRIGLIYNI